MSSFNFLSIAKASKALILRGTFIFLSACGSKKDDDNNDDKFGVGSKLGQLDTMMGKKQAAIDTPEKPVVADTVAAVLNTHDCNNDCLSLNSINFLRKFNRIKKIDTMKSMCFSFVRVRMDTSNSLREYGRGKENKPEHTEFDYAENVFVYDRHDAICIYTYNEKEFLNILENISANGQAIQNNGVIYRRDCLKEYQIYLLNGVRYIFFKYDENNCRGNQYSMGYAIFIVNNAEYKTNDEYLIFK